MKKVPFSKIKTAGFFKEVGCDTWYMKVNSEQAEYRSNGISGKVHFNKEELVLVED